MKAIGFCIIGTLILIIGIAYLINRIVFVKRAKTIKGKIIKIKEDYIDNMKSYFPVIEYLDDSGKRCVFESNTGYITKYRVGDIINLRYYRVGKKNIVCEDTTFALFGIALIFIPIGLLFSIIGVYGVFGFNF